MATVSVLGLGAMGQAIAGALLRSDYEVTVWNRTSGREGVLRSVAGNSSYLGDDAGLPAVYDAALLTLLYATMTGWLQAFDLITENGITAKVFLPHATDWFRNVVAADDAGAIAEAVDRREYPDTIPSPVALNPAAMRLLIEVHDESGVDGGLIRAISALAERRVVAGHGGDSYTSLIEAIRAPGSVA